MKRKKNKLVNLLKTGILFFGVSVLLWNCEKEELLPAEKELAIKKERISKSITFETLENTDVYKYFNQELQLDLKTDKKINQFEKGTQKTNDDLTIITQKINQVINNGIETFSMFIKYNEQQENTYYNLVLYKKDNLYRIYTLKIETSKKLHGKGTSVGMETDVTVQSGIIPYDGWDDIGDDSSTGGDGYEWQCWTVTLQIPYACGSGHYPNQGCTGSPTAPYWPGYNYITDSDCGYVYIGTDSNPIDSGNDSGNTGGGGNTSDTDNSIDVDAVNPNEIVPEGAAPIEWFDDQVFVDESFKNEPCLKSVYDQMGKATKFKEYLQNFEATASVAHLRFKYDENFSANQPNENWSAIAITEPPLAGQNNSNVADYNIEITFNGDINLTSSIHNKPKLIIAVSFIHEIIHAEVFRKMLSAAQQGHLNTNLYTTQNRIDYINSLRNNFEGIYDYYVERWKPNWGHQQMAQHYIDTIVSALKQYDDNQHTQEQYEAIAWLGLEGTIAWQNLDEDPNLTTEQEQDNITETRTNFIDNDTNKCN
jgi:hypothetical protein